MLKETLEILDRLDDPHASGRSLLESFKGVSDAIERETWTVVGDDGDTDAVRIVIPGGDGKRAGGTAATVGIIGRHGGSGARPSRIGYVSDGDGATAALAAALKLARMHQRGDQLAGDVIVTTHVCPDAPTKPHEPVEFMGSPISTEQNNAAEVSLEMDAIVSIDTTKGNGILNHRGIAVTPTIRQGWILPVAHDVVALYERVCGIPAVVLPVSQADITPYGNGLYHLNSILQPANATDAPVVGVAITAETVVPGSATGASHETDIALAARFAIETAKDLGSGRTALFDAVQAERMIALYGEMRHLQTSGTA